MMRRAARRDGNSAAIIAAYLAHGCTWADLAAVGAGVPDGAVGVAGVTDLCEIKNPAGRNRVGANQQDWHRTWRGSCVWIVRTLADVQEHVADMRRRARAVAAAPPIYRGPA